MKAKLALRPAPPVRVQRQPVTSALAHKPPGAQPALRIIDGGLDPGSVLRLQSAAGNQAVGAAPKSAEAIGSAATGIGEEVAGAPKPAEPGSVAGAAAGEAVAGAPKP